MIDRTGLPRRQANGRMHPKWQARQQILSCKRKDGCISENRLDCVAITNNSQILFDFKKGLILIHTIFLPSNFDVTQKLLVYMLRGGELWQVSY